MQKFYIFKRKPKSYLNFFKVLMKGLQFAVYVTVLTFSLPLKNRLPIQTCPYVNRYEMINLEDIVL